MYLCEGKLLFGKGKVCITVGKKSLLLSEKKIVRGNTLLREYGCSGESITTILKETIIGEVKSVSERGKHY